MTCLSAVRLILRRASQCLPRNATGNETRSEVEVEVEDRVSSGEDRARYKACISTIKKLKEPGRQHIPKDPAKHPPSQLLPPPPPPQPSPLDRPETACGDSAPMTESITAAPNCTAPAKQKKKKHQTELNWELIFLLFFDSREDGLPETWLTRRVFEPSRYRQ